ncbi:MAG: ACT domain-containing protein [Bacillota bacterium]|nr:ACT domain-containing protein [Bacillota bacterium]
MIKQISIFLENKSGRLVKVSKVLEEAKINIRGLSIADTSDFGILRLIVNQPEKALSTLKEYGIMATVTEVIAVEVPDKPGGLAGILACLNDAGINIEYLYSFIDKPAHNAIIMIRVEKIADALKTLKNNNIPIVSGKKIYSY